MAISFGRVGTVHSDGSFGWTVSCRCLRGLQRYNCEPLYLPSPQLWSLLRWVFAITALLRSSCSLPTSSLRWLAGVVLRTNHSYPSLLQPALFQSTFCLIPMSFVLTSDNGPGGAPAACAAFWSVCSEFSTQLRKLIGCRPRSPPRLLKSRHSCLPLFALKRGLSTRHAWLDFTCGLV